MEAFADFETDRAGRYLSALCHHFGRKIEAHCLPDKGWVQFPLGRCEMTADERRLKLVVSADDEQQLDHLVDILTRHLERFAFREDPQLEWHLDSTVRQS